MIWLLVLLMWCGVGEVRAEAYREVRKVETFGPIGGINRSQYSPWVMHEQGWGSYVMYYCRATEENGKSGDRVWRAQNWGDGVDGPWTENQIVVEGQMGQTDDWSCSPGVVIGSDGIWHMYYVTSERSAGCDLYLHHATSTAPGINWVKKGVVNISNWNWPVKGCGMDTASPYLVDGKIKLFIPLTPGKLMITESVDGHNFDNSRIINLPDVGGGFGRVTMVGNKMYYVYGRSSGGDPYRPPSQIWMTTSGDGGNSFLPGVKLFESNGNGWDGNLMWQPQVTFFGGKMQVYYAGNTPDPARDGNPNRFWGDNTSMGVREFEIVDSCRIQGFKVGADGEACNGTNCPSEARVTIDGGYQSSDNPYVIYGVKEGVKRVTLSVPSGYQSEYSNCNGCTDHTESSWVGGSTVMANCEAGSHADLWWRLKKTTVTPTKKPTATPTKGTTKGDADNNGKVNVADFAVWKTEYLTKSGTKSDFDKNGRVTIADFAIWKTEYLRLK